MAAPVASNHSSIKSKLDKSKVVIIPAEKHSRKCINVPKVSSCIQTNPSTLANSTSKSSASSSTAPSNITVFSVPADFLMTLLRNCPGVPAEIPDKILMIAPSTVLNTNVKAVPEHSESSATAPVRMPYVKSSKKKIIKQFKNVTEMLLDEQMKRKEKERIRKKEKLLKKMLIKYEEKEEKKQVKYFQKKLARFVEKNQDHLQGSKDKLLEVIFKKTKIFLELKSLKHISESEVINKVLSDVMLKSLINDDASDKSVGVEVRKMQQKESVQGLVKQSKKKVQNKCSINSSSSLIKNKVCKQTLNSPKPKSKNIFSSIPSNISVHVYDTAQKRVIKHYKKDPYTDMSIITRDRFTIQCLCLKENCEGLHPELAFL